MIVTLRVPTLVEESINVGIEGESETPEETAEEFVANSSTSEKGSFYETSWSHTNLCRQRYRERG